MSLRPCPFCSEKKPKTEFFAKYTTIWCEVCGASITRPTTAEAIPAWNERPAAAPVAGSVKRYSLEWNKLECGCNDLLEDPEGAFMRYTDYAALEARCAELERERDGLKAGLNYIATEKSYWQCQGCGAILKESETEIHEGTGEYPAESEFAACPHCHEECDELFPSQVAEAFLKQTAQPKPTDAPVCECEGCLTNGMHEHTCNGTGRKP